VRSSNTAAFREAVKVALREQENELSTSKLSKCKIAVNAVEQSRDTETGNVKKFEAVIKPKSYQPPWRERRPTVK
jgi:hypothetical protein